MDVLSDPLRCPDPSVSPPSYDAPAGATSGPVAESAHAPRLPITNTTATAILVLCIWSAPRKRIHAPGPPWPGGVLTKILQTHLFCYFAGPTAKRHYLGLRARRVGGYAGGMRRNEISRRAIRVLTYLLELTSRESGYRIHGVRGWGTARDVEEGTSTWSVSEVLSAQVQSGRAIRVDVRTPGDTKPVWAYRINQKGADVLAAAVGIAPAGIDSPSGDRGAAVYIREGAWVALSALRSATDNPPKHEKVWVVGQSGWRSSRELTRLMEREDEEAGLSPGRCFFSEDLAWLVRIGYAQQKVVAKTHIYRLTPSGASAQRLDWKEPGDA